MLRFLLAGAIAALAFVPAALGDGAAAPGVLQGGKGLVAPSGTVRYVTIAGAETTVEALSTRSGEVLRWTENPGSWGIPLVTFTGTLGGLSHDGRRLVLADATPPNALLRSLSRFVVLDTKTFGLRRTIELRGDFAFDALSPDGRRLYLIQHLSAANLSRYVVRAYDLAEGRLLPGRIADRTQRGWVMQGYPVARMSSADGRWAYTLYQNPGGYPFVHALDTVRGVAHCIGIPWTGDQAELFRMKLSLTGGGRSLRLTWKSEKPLFTIDTRTYRIDKDDGGSTSGLPWWALGLAAGAVPALAGAALIRRVGRGVRALPGV
jgi:hypothetical protein